MCSGRTRFFPDEGPLLETLIFFEISYGSKQPFNFLPKLCLVIAVGKILVVDD